MTEEIKAKEEAEKIRIEAEKDQRIKEKYKAIHKETIIDEHGQEHSVYFKKPNRLAVGASLARIDHNVTEACEIIFYDAIIKEESDHEYFINNDEAFNALIRPLQRLVRVKKSTSTTL